MASCEYRSLKRLVITLWGRSNTVGFFGIVVVWCKRLRCSVPMQVHEGLIERLPVREARGSGLRGSSRHNLHPSTFTFCSHFRNSYLPEIIQLQSIPVKKILRRGSLPRTSDNSISTADKTSVSNRVVPDTCTCKGLPCSLEQIRPELNSKRSKFHDVE